MMKVKKIKILLSLFVLAACLFSFVVVPSRATAETTGPAASTDSTATPPAETEATPTDEPKYVNNDCDKPDLNQNNCGIIKYLVLFIKFLSAVVGVAVVASIIIGGIQYSVSADDPSVVTAAKKRIMNALLALVVYIFSFAILQYLIPGGIL